MKRSWARPRRAVAAAALGLLITSGLIVSGTRQALAEGDLRFEAHSTYTVDPAARTVRVFVDMIITNQKPNSNDGVYITQYYFNQISVPMLSSARNLRAVRDGREQSITTEPSRSGEFTFAIVDLSPNLYFRDVARVQLTYEMPSEPPRGDASTRVNSAYATFWAFPVADPNLTSVRIVIPKAFDVETFGSDMDQRTDGNNTLFESGAISDPFAWGVIVSARNDNGLDIERLRSGSHRVQIRSWPDDKEWAQYVTRLTTDGLPALESLTELPWSNDDTLTITETVSPYLYGYAGWYQSSDNTIEIGDELDGEVVLHEISHIWFNDDLFDDRWVNEGFAQTYSNLALAEIGEDARQPRKPNAGAKGAQPLVKWGEPNFRDDEQTRAEEEYGYNAAWYVIDQITDEIGPEEMRGIFAAVDSNRITFVGDLEAETMKTDVNWRRLLDLVEYEGDSKKAEQLFSKYVLERGDRDDLRDRNKAHRAYERLVTKGDGWSAPFVVRQQLTGWRFDAATESIENATKILAVRDDIVATLDGTGVALPKSFESDFEAADQDGLETVLESAEEFLAAAKTIAAAHDAADAGKGIFDKVGLWGNDYEQELAGADRDFEAGRIDDAVDGAEAVSETLDDAAGVGQQRSGITAGSIIGLLLLVFIVRKLIRSRRRKRRARETAAIEARSATLADDLTRELVGVGGGARRVVSWGSPGTWAPTAAPPVEARLSEPTLTEPGPTEPPRSEPGPIEPGPVAGDGQSETAGESFLEPPHPA